MLRLMASAQDWWAVVMHQSSSPKGLRLQQWNRPGLRRGFCVFLISVFLCPLALPIDLSSIRNLANPCNCESHCTCQYCKVHHRAAPRLDDSTVFLSQSNACPCSEGLPATLSASQFILAHAQNSWRADTSMHALAQGRYPQPRYTYIRLRQKRGPPFTFISA